jgi:hypothetical protein
VPYKGGNPAMTAIISGQVGMGFASLASVRVHEQAGRVRLLAIASAKRSQLAPDVPTLNETVPGVVLETWVGMLAPAGVPQNIGMRFRGLCRDDDVGAILRRALRDREADAATSARYEKSFAFQTCHDSAPLQIIAAS